MFGVALSIKQWAFVGVLLGEEAIRLRSELPLETDDPQWFRERADCFFTLSSGIHAMLENDPPGFTTPLRINPDQLPSVMNFFLDWVSSEEAQKETDENGGPSHCIQGVFSLFGAVGAQLDMLKKIGFPFSPRSKDVANAVQDIMLLADLLAGISGPAPEPEKPKDADKVGGFAVLTKGNGQIH